MHKFFCIVNPSQLSGFYILPVLDCTSIVLLLYWIVLDCTSIVLLYSKINTTYLHTYNHITRNIIVLPFSKILYTSILPELPLQGVFDNSGLPVVITRMYPAHCVANGEFYVLNGWRGSVLTSLQKYNPQTNTVSTLASNAAGSYASTMCHYNAKLYVHHSAGTIYIYDISSNTWSTVTPTGFTGATREYCSSAIIGSTMYIHGGYTNATSYSPRLYAYDVLTNTWTEKASSPIDITKGLEGVQTELIHYNGMLYLPSTNGLHMYNPSTDTWSTLNSSAIYGRGCINRDVLYVLNTASTDAFMGYDFSTNTWSKVGTWSTRIYYGSLMGADEVSTEIYSIAGSLNASTAIGTIYRIT